MKTQNRLARAMALTPAIEPGYWGMPFALMGHVGTAKSAALRQLASELGMTLVTLYGGRVGPQDLVLAIPSGDGTNRYSINEKIAEIPENSILFLEEITETRSDVHAIFQSLILERTIGKYKLPKTCIIVIAGNPRKISANGHEIPCPFSNRASWLQAAVPTANEVNTYLEAKIEGRLEDLFEKGIIDAPAERERVMKSWKNCLKAANAVLSKFRSAHEGDGVLNSPPETWRPKELGDLCFPTPRSNEAALHIVATSIVHGLSKTQRDILLKATCGAKWLDMFIAYESAHGIIPDPLAWLDGAVEWSHDPARPDISLMLFSQAGIAVKGTDEISLRDHRAGILWQEIGRAAKSDPLVVDLIQPVVHDLKNAGFLNSKFVEVQMSDLFEANKRGGINVNG
jgi:hypothetical protein